jgi:hypothetical protein
LSAGSYSGCAEQACAIGALKRPRIPAIYRQSELT